ncbi:MAG: YhjD/YihY/BrkB family envelope integrity protein, partial [Spirochaetota bacterium]
MMFKKKDKKEGDGFKRIALNTFKLITGEQRLSERAYGKIRKRLVRSARILFASTEKFMADDCLSKASSIAYTFIVSLIPTLAVGLTFFSIFGAGNQKEEIFAKITKFMAENNLSRLNIDPYLDTISSIIDNAASIGGVGAVVLIFSATAILRTLEHSLNTIWKVKRERSWVAKIIYYWATLTLGPIMLIAGTTAAAQISSTLTKSNYHAIEITGEGRIWTVGNKADIRYTDKMPPEYREITTDQIDFDNQVISAYDYATRIFSKDDFVYEALDFKKSQFNDIQFIGNTGWAAGRNGLILKTINGGKSWKIQKWGSFSFNDIHMTDAKNGCIAADNGYMLTTADGGASWNVRSWPELTVNIKSIAVKGKTGIAVCDKGFILRSADGGVNWSPEKPESLKIKKRHLNLNSVFLLNERTGMIAADDGTIVTTHDAFAHLDMRHFKGYKYTSALLVSETEGYVGGENGILIHTTDAGETWQQS